MKINKKLILNFIGIIPAFAVIILGYKYANAVSVTTTIFEGSDPCTYWKSVFDFAVLAAGVLTATVVAGGGLYYVVSFGQEERLKNAKAMMTGGIVGMMLALSSWGLFNLLAPTLLQCKIDLPEVDLGGTEQTDPCEGYHEDDLFNTQEECMASGSEEDGECDGTCVQQLEASGEQDSGTSCESNEECGEGETCEGADSEQGTSGTCTGGETSDEEGSNEDEESEEEGDGRKWCCVTSSGLWELMQSFCTGDSSVEGYQELVRNWAEITPGEAAYVGAGRMSGGICNASGSETYYTRKLNSSGGYRSQWVDPVNGDMDQAISDYRAWANSLGGRYCGDCFTFSRELYRCVGASGFGLGLNSSSGADRTYSASEFYDGISDGSITVEPGTYIWVAGGDCSGHAVNYTGISGSEVIEMGGGRTSLSVNGHTASSVAVTSSLQSRMANYSRRSGCNVYVTNMLNQ
jgi:hypothetical protein